MYFNEIKSTQLTAHTHLVNYSFKSLNKDSKNVIFILIIIKLMLTRTIRALFTHGHKHLNHAELSAKMGDLRKQIKLTTE
jgi:hypothetical protein